MKQKEPTVIEKEELEKFNSICKSLINDNFKKMNVDVSTLKLNMIGLAISAPVAALIYWLYLMAYGSIPWFSKFSLTSFIFLIVFVLAVLVHELIHGFTWSLFCENKWKSIRFKIIWEYLMPCCICSECIPQFGYVLGLAMPIIILGFAPCIISFMITNHYLMLFSLVMIVCGGGDVYFIWKIRKLKEWVLIDHPITRDCIAFKKKNK